MKGKIGKIMIITGIVCVLAALSLFAYNKIASFNAAKFAEEVVRELQQNTCRQVDETTQSGEEASPGLSPAVEMRTQIVREYEFIGYLSIPSLWLNLPVMSDWSYEKLNVSPCLYSGSPATDDFVIAAHNYTSHFGFISGLNNGDTVSFVDVDGNQTDYRVELIDTLSPTDVENMTAGEYDLTLFTCTYSGQARVTVRLNRIQE